MTAATPKITTPIGPRRLDDDYYDFLCVLKDKQLPHVQRYFEATILLAMIGTNKTNYDLTFRQAKELTGTEHQTIKKWIKSGNLSHIMGSQDPSSKFKFQRMWGRNPKPYYGNFTLEQMKREGEFFETLENIQFHGEADTPLWPHQNLWLHRGNGKGIAYLIYVLLYLNAAPMTVTELTTAVGLASEKGVRSILKQFLIDTDLIVEMPGTNTAARGPSPKVYDVDLHNMVVPIQEEAHSIPDKIGQWNETHELQREVWVRYQEAKKEASEKDSEG